MQLTGIPLFILLGREWDRELASKEESQPINALHDVFSGDYVLWNLYYI